MSTLLYLVVGGIVGLLCFLSGYIVGRTSPHAKDSDQ